MIRWLAAALMLAVTAAFVHLHPPEDLSLGRGILRAVPTQYGPWSGSDRSFGEGVADELQADDLLLRRYESGEDGVWLCLIYHQNRRYGAHDPQVCYESQGFVVTSEGQAHVDDGTPHGLDVNTFVAERKGVRRTVWYWWTTDGLSTRDAGAFRRRMAFLGALDNRSWGAFVRVESVATNDDLRAANARVRDFSARVARSLPAVFTRARQAAAPPS